MTAVKTRLKDIARLAGVSIGTVDRVLHERGEVAVKTRERVKRILEETKYSPDLMAQVLKSRKGYHIISLLPEPSKDNVFWEKHSAGIKRALEELNFFHITLTQVSFDMLDEKDFQLKADDVLNLNPDGVLLAPIFKSESITFCNFLTEMRIPFVFVDGFIENTEFLAYIGEDIFSSGRVAGQLADLITPEKSDILIVSIARNIENVHHLNHRMEGFLDYFEKSGRNRGRKLKVTIPDASLLSVATELDKAFARYPDTGTIFMSGSKSYLIAEYLELKGFKTVHLIGYDLLDNNVRYLRSGIIRFLIGQRPEEQTYKAVKKLLEYLSLSRLPESMEYLPIDIITSENVDFFLTKAVN